MRKTWITVGHVDWTRRLAHSPPSCRRPEVCVRSEAPEFGKAEGEGRCRKPEEHAPKQRRNRPALAPRGREKDGVVVKLDDVAEEEEESGLEKYYACQAQDASDVLTR